MGGERTIDIPPRASALINSLRGLGYSPEAAIADLIDNSITAGATVLKIDLQWNDGRPTAAILDNGSGMNEKRLVAAMQLGGDGPSAVRGDNDLGRFGMGLKTASLSQSSRMTVVSRTDDAISAITLDVAFITAHGWVASVPDPLPDHPLVANLLARPSGTAVLWEDIDELSGLFGLSKEAFYLRLEEIRAQLGMVFHRFIDGDAGPLAITLNERPIKAWDPFQAQHPATIAMPVEKIRHAGSSLSVKPYVLPHRDRFLNESEYEAAGGPGGWGARQGFYVYRGKRLLVAGSWLGLGGSRTWTRDEASRLARIQVDLPTDMDRDWRIDVRKSQARPPGALRARLTAIAGHCRLEAREVFAFRGQGPRIRGTPREAVSVWLATSGPKGTQYRINRDHPVIAACREAAGGLRSLNAVLSILERSIPVERIWLDISESQGSETPALHADEIALLADQLTELSRTLPKSMTLDQRIDTLLLNLPGDLTKLKAELVRKLGNNND
ncbi:ATP-binding protein [Achromobacter insolitus]|uniref:ATP-binding protein n=1 Tax=Achromobacter insolitus TaxID=217204 RepID=UPI000DD16D4B|nr:ATP-binding protein [Achromobacter insolitus]AXA74361.1 ATP-binding protein [Achromobacter insolitus]